jgi:SAM-dependent methyltransferase
MPQAMVVGLDFSEAARVASERCRDLPNVHILQADLSRPPFASGIFDFVWSEGVIHHTPETAESLAKLSSLVRPGGKIYVWIYSSVVTSPYRLARRVLRKSYLLPPAILYGLAWSLAVALHGMNKIRELLSCVCQSSAIAWLPQRAHSTMRSLRNSCTATLRAKSAGGSPGKDLSK